MGAFLQGHRQAERDRAAGPFAWYLTNRFQEFLFAVFDLDAAKGDVQRDVAELVDLLEQAELSYLVCASGPAGGLHVWVPVRPVGAGLVDAIARAAARRLPTLDISPLTNPKTGCVRPPGAPHRHGGMSVPLANWRPITAAATAAVLSRANEVERLQRLAVLLNADPASQVSQEGCQGSGQVGGRRSAAAVRAVESGTDGPRLAYLTALVTSPRCWPRRLSPARAMPCCGRSCCGWRGPAGRPLKSPRC
ncbi:hypothetical protein ACFQX6_66265 [Streptosporangium lutulentum]